MLFYLPTNYLDLPPSKSGRIPLENIFFSDICKEIENLEEKINEKINTFASIHNYNQKYNQTQTPSEIEKKKEENEIDDLMLGYTMKIGSLKQQSEEPGKAVDAYLNDMFRRLCGPKV